MDIFEVGSQNVPWDVMLLMHYVSVKMKLRTVDQNVQNELLRTSGVGVRNLGKTNRGKAA